MNVKAKTAFALPQSNKSGTRKNSKEFIIAITRICITVLSRVRIPLKIQTAIPISATPIRNVRDLACSLPKILVTISWCRGTRFRTLQISPLTIQTVAMK